MDNLTIVDVVDMLPLFPQLGQLAVQPEFVGMGQSLIEEMEPALQYTIADRYLDDPDENVQQCLKLGMSEIIAGELMSQIAKQQHIAPEQWHNLIVQGAGRLAPFLKSSLLLDPEATPGEQ